MSNWEVVLLEPARAMLSQVSSFLISALLVIIVLLLGWLFSKAVKTVVTKILKMAKVDEVAGRIGLDKILNKGGITYSIPDLMGGLCYWIGLLITFIVAANSIQLTIVATLLNTVVLYIPNVIAALFVLILGMFVSTLLKNIVQTTANNAGLSQGKLLAQIVETIVLVFAFLVGLEQLRIGIQLTQVTLAIILGSMGLAFALAFGLGCKEIAGKFVSELTEKLKKK